MEKSLKENAASEGNDSNYHLKNEFYTTTLKDIRWNYFTRMTEQIGEKHS